MNKPGGNFIAGEPIYLVSLVTYNDCPVRWKLVAFEVRNPMDEIVLIRTAVTDENGLATIWFRTPVLPISNGTWTAISTVDVAGTVVLDTISFQVSFIMPVGGNSYSMMAEYEFEKILTAYLISVLTLTASVMEIKRRIY
ncbi:MAG: hypothetical protein NZ932_03225 [Candidatus Bathyarchaeota archaeon]|nr:hypothetical protein [Candidatus Bathyarchaeota archaeon]MDW8022593.1 hypothetical protein [Nitrososphaerota archaeon]